MPIFILNRIYHKVRFILPIFFLPGCIGYTPTYYDDNIEFTIHVIDNVPYDKQDDIRVYTDDKEIEFEKEKCFYKDHSLNKRALQITYCSQEKDTSKNNCNSFYDIRFNVKREYQNKTIKITKHGKANTIFNLYPQITNEKWASGKSEIGLTGDTSAGMLLLPTNTYKVISVCGEAVRDVFKGVPHSGGITVSCLAFIPMAVGVDIYNVIIGLPSTAIINPWTNYRIESVPLKSKEI